MSKSKPGVRDLLDRGDLPVGIETGGVQDHENLVGRLPHEVARAAGFRPADGGERQRHDEENGGCGRELHGTSSSSNSSSKKYRS